MIEVTNPILRGFHPDPSVLRVGEDYYLATSTFEWFPGVEIRHSRDLVHWEIVARPLDRPELLDLRGVLNGGGVWAPCLSHSDGLFYLVYTITRTFDETTQDTENFLVTARDVRGPWSERIPLNAGGFDPSMFHDGDGSKWLVSMRWDSRPGENHFPGILLQRYDPEEKRLVGEAKLIFTGTELGFTEGPHLYRRGGLYYLMTAEGGTAAGHAVTVCRSERREGPYAVDPMNPMLTARDDPAWPIQCAGHGSLVEGPDGGWYLFHLGSRKNRFGGWSVPGRETFLQNVRWDEDGWLRLSAGGYHPAETALAPAAEAQKDDFYRKYEFFGILDPHFLSLRVPPDRQICSMWARPGFLRLFGRESILSHHRQSFLGMQICDVPFSATTELEFEPAIYQQAAGLCLFYHTANFYYLQITWHEKLGKCVRLMIRDGRKTRLSPAMRLADGPVLLRADMTALEVRFFFRTLYDEGWTEIAPDGAPLPTRILSDEYAGVSGEQGFTGAFVGLCCQDQTGSALPADFRFLDIARLE